MRVLASVALGLVLVGCATGKVGNVSGNANVNIGSSAPVPVVKTIVETCAPPPALLQKHPPLALITKQRLTRAEELNLHLDDIASYNDLNVDDGALIDWVVTNCRG